MAPLLGIAASAGIIGFSTALYGYDTYKNKQLINELQMGGIPSSGLYVR